MAGAACRAARPVAQLPAQPSGSQRRLDEAAHPPGLRRPALLPARLLRVQDGPAVRLREVHARQRRRAAASANAWWNIQHEEPPPAPPAEQRTASAVVGALGQQVATPPPTAPASRRPAGLAAGFGYYIRQTLADGVHSGSGRTRAADDNTDYYPVPLTQDNAASGHGLRRSVRAHPGARAARAADRRRGRRLPRRRRAARRHGRAQALLARQLPVRRRSGARQPRLQALPAGRRRPVAACCAA